YNAGTICGPQTQPAVSTTTGPLPTPPTYSVKVVNPKKRSDFAVSKLSYEGFFKDIRHLKKVMLATFPDEFDVDGQIGYIQPGHGAKGRQLWLTSNADVQQMSEPKSKHPCPDTSGASKADSISHTLSEVDKIVTTLTEKHSKKYTVEQIMGMGSYVTNGKT
uniref:Uncharacterized protein n=1 Tax=Amphimedon queenslandica TaxID=400682 RepID=A0A1X7VE09_AMPQE